MHTRRLPMITASPAGPQRALRADVWILVNGRLNLARPYTSELFGEE